MDRHIDKGMYVCVLVTAPVHGETETIIHIQTHFKLFYVYMLVFLWAWVFPLCLNTEIFLTIFTLLCVYFIYI